MRVRVLSPLLVVCLAAVSILPWPALAKGGGGGEIAIGFNGGTVSSRQEHLNTLVQRANTRDGGISASDLDGAYEAALFFMYRFSGSIYALMLRPSYFYAVEKGTGGSGTYKYGVTGFTIFPTFRIYPLENDFMRFFMQIGLGYGRANTDVQEGTASVKGVGGAFGTALGLGSEFCITPAHCITVEGNYRYLNIERNIATQSSGTFAGNSLSQATKDREIEMDSTDVAVRMSGMQFLFGYAMYF